MGILEQAKLDTERRRTRRRRCDPDLRAAGAPRADVPHREPRDVLQLWRDRPRGDPVPGHDEDRLDTRVSAPGREECGV